MSSSSIITICAFAFYMAVMIAIGAIYSRSTKNNADYFLGGRNLGAWTAAISAEASDMSGWLLMGLPGAFYFTGVINIWTAVGLLIGTILNWFFVSGRLRKYTIASGNSLTIPSFFDNRFKSKGVLKVVAAIIIAVFFAVYTASAFSAGAKLFATLFEDKSVTATATITFNENKLQDGFSVETKEEKVTAESALSKEGIEDGYYLIKNADWGSEAKDYNAEAVKLISTSDKFEATDSNGNYTLEAVYTEGDTAKVVKVSDGRITDWYGTDGNSSEDISKPSNGSEDSFTPSYDKSYTLGLIIASAVILIYTFLGGFKAVCTTDLIQGMLMILALLSVPIIAYSIMKGGDSYTTFNAALTAKGVSDTGAFLSPFTKATDVISGLAWGLGYFGMPHILVRFMAIKNHKELKKSRGIAIVWVTLAFIASFFIGILGRAFVDSTLSEAASENVFIEMIKQIFTNNGFLVFIGGIFLCGILAAIMSTADSQLLVTASAISEDMYKGVINKKASEKSALLLGRIAVAVIAVIAFVIAFDKNSSIMKLVSDAWAGFGAAFGPIVLLALYWKRSNWQGALAGMISGALTVIAWDYIPFVGGQTIGAATGLYSLAVGFPVALVVMIIVSLISKAPDKKIVEEFECVKNAEL